MGEQDRHGNASIRRDLHRSTDLTNERFDESVAERAFATALHADTVVRNGEFDTPGLATPGLDPDRSAWTLAIAINRSCAS